MPSFQARKDQLSRPVRSEALSSSSRWTWGLPVRIGSESAFPPASCDRFLRLVPNPSRREGTNSAALRPRCDRYTPRARRRCQQVECTGCSGFSSATSQPVWDADNTGADHFSPRVSAVPQLLWRIPRRSRPRDTGRGPLAVGEVAPLFVGRRSRPVDRRGQWYKPQAASRSGDLLMLARLGLRAGDVACLRVTDIDWKNGTLQVTGKGRYQVRLPLPQDVGDALLRYLECRSGNIDTDHVFIRSIAP